MLPHLTSLNGGLAGTPVQVPPPPKFRPIQGQIQNAKLVSASARPDQFTAAQRGGLRYESKVLKWLEGSYPGRFTKSPAFHFRDDTGWRICIPDGLLDFFSRMIVLEIKSQHMPEAWWQLRKLYEPVVQRVYKRPVMVIEICRSFDAGMPFPEKVTLIENLEHFARSAPVDSFGVMQWKP